MTVYENSNVNTDPSSDLHTELLPASAAYAVVYDDDDSDCVVLCPETALKIHRFMRWVYYESLHTICIWVLLCFFPTDEAHIGFECEPGVAHEHALIQHYITLSFLCVTYAFNNALVNGHYDVKSIIKSLNYNLKVNDDKIIEIMTYLVNYDKK